MLRVNFNKQFQFKNNIAIMKVIISSALNYVAYYNHQHNKE